MLVGISKVPTNRDFEGWNSHQFEIGKGAINTNGPQPNGPKSAWVWRPKGRGPISNLGDRPIGNSFSQLNRSNEEFLLRNSEGTVMHPINFEVKGGRQYRGVVDEEFINAWRSKSVSNHGDQSSGFVGIFDDRVVSCQSSNCSATLATPFCQSRLEGLFATPEFSFKVPPMLGPSLVMCSDSSGEFSR